MSVDVLWLEPQACVDTTTRFLLCVGASSSNRRLAQQAPQRPVPASNTAGHTFSDDCRAGLVASNEECRSWWWSVLGVADGSACVVED